MKKVNDILELALIGALAFFLGVGIVDLTRAVTKHYQKPITRELAADQVYTLPQTADNGIVRLVGEDGKTYCTGSIVDGRTVITAGHCVAIPTPFGMMVNPNPIDLRLNDNVYRGTFGAAYSITPQLDTAVIHGNFKRYQKLKLLDDIHQIQNIGSKHTKLLACGYPLHGDLHCQTITFHDLENFMWSVDGLLLPGMSGGPVITPEGYVIGINDAVEGNRSIIAPTFNVKRGF